MVEPLTVRVDPGVYRHEKTVKAAEALGVRSTDLVRLLTLLWAVARRQGGTVLDLTGVERSRVPSRMLALAREIDYGKDVPVLLDTLTKVGYLERQGLKFVAHDWGYWQGLKVARVTTARQEEVPVRERADEPSDLPDKLRGTNWFGHFMWWLVEGFGHTGYKSKAADVGYLTQHGSGEDFALIAETYVAIADGQWGDDFDKRALSARHAMNKSNAFRAFKRRRGVDTIIHPTEIGARYHPSRIKHRGGLAGGDAEEAPGGSGVPDPFAVGTGSYKLDEHPKYGGGTAGSTGRAARAGSVSG
jgi:hypothetical protein